MKKITQLEIALCEILKFQLQEVRSHFIYPWDDQITLTAQEARSHFSWPWVGQITLIAKVFDQITLTAEGFDQFAPIQEH